MVLRALLAQRRWRRGKRGYVSVSDLFQTNLPKTNLTKSAEHGTTA